MESFYVFTLIVIIVTIKENLGHFVNYTSLMRHYFLLCGPEYFCLEPNETYKWDLEASFSFKNIPLCPSCSCDNACIGRRDCCPDLFFSFPMECVDPVIIQGTSDRARNEQSFALMVKSCPDGTGPDMTLKCTNLTDTRSRLLNFPVTAAGFPVSYYNVNCAKCNGVQKLIPWALDIHCLRFADFNYLSSVDDVITLAYERECIFQAYKLNKNGTEETEKSCIGRENDVLYTACNQTGEWEKYDPDVQYACESPYKKKFRFFKNIFCYMCNPSGRFNLKRVEANCNNTGKWKHFNSTIEKGCNKLPFTSHTWPYKNIFCYMCNRVNDSSRPFVDITGNVTENVEYGYYRFQYEVMILKFDLTYLKFTAERSKSQNPHLNVISLTPFSQTSFLNKHGNFINLTSLLAYKAATVGNVDFCNGRKFDLPKRQEKCSCDLNCVLSHNRPCCSDFALEIPASCINDFKLSGTLDIPHNKPYLVIDGCLGERRYLLFEKECRTPRNNSIFSLLPVSEHGGISYKNLYCVLCNLYSQHYINKLNNITNLSPRYDEPRDTSQVLNTYLKKYDNLATRYKIWQLQLRCPKYLDYSHILTAGNLISLAHKIKCIIQYTSTDEGSKVCDVTFHYSECSDSQNWTYMNKDIEWACNEAVGNPIYTSFLWRKNRHTFVGCRELKNETRRWKNVYCALCNPLKTFTANFIDECPSFMSSKDCENFPCPSFMSNKDCENLPRTYLYYPFKNMACAICHNVVWFNFEEGYCDNEYYAHFKDEGYPGIQVFRTGQFGFAWYPILRTLFSFTQEDGSDERNNLKRNNCTENQIFDDVKNICRDIKCYDGKYLKGSECIPLLPITRNLKYLLQMKAHISFNEMKSKKNIVENALSVISKRLIEKLDFERGHISATLIDESCRNCTEESGQNVMSIDVAVEVFIRSSILRNDTEVLLLQIFNNSLNGSDSISGIFISHLSSKTPTDEVLSENINSYLEVGENKREKRSSSPSSASFLTSVVSEVILCKQIELETDEYIIFRNTSTLFLTRNSMEIGINKFARSPVSNQVRICYDYLIQLGYLPSEKIWEEQEDSNDNRALWIVSMICTVLSVLSLCVSLIFYFLLSDLRTTSGKLIMIMMVSLLFTLVFFQLSTLMIQSKMGCLAVGVILHFSWLSVFFSMNVCNYRTFTVFVSKTLKKTNVSKSKVVSKELRRGIVYTFGMPLLCISLNVTIASYSKGKMVSGYGGVQCFIDTFVSSILTFVCPVLAVLTSNVIFFLLSARAIRRTPSISSNQEQRSEFAIYLRLTSITGISWLLQIVDIFLPLSAFTYIATSVILLQGLFIFLAFVAKRRHLKLIISLHRSKRHGRDKQEEFQLSNTSNEKK